MDEISDKSWQKLRGTGIKSKVPGKRPELITDLLSRMNKGLIDQNVASDVLKRIQFRMDQVPAETLNGPRKKRAFSIAQNRLLRKVVSKPQIRFKGKAQADRESAVRLRRMSIYRRSATQPLSLRWGFKTTSK